MPPRRTKPRLTRMDAACDHLQRMGFPRAEIRKTANHLLKEVYVGYDAWPFLEEDSYRVLIEALLEKQDIEEPGDEPPKRDYAPHGERTEPLEACESMNETYCIGETSASHGNLVEGGDAKRVMTLDVSEFSSGISLCCEQNHLTYPSDTGFAGDAHEQGRHCGEGCELPDGCSTRRRLPCYGWISEDEEEIICALPPTTCREQAMVQCSLSFHCDRKRKSRWDAKPYDKE